MIASATDRPNVRKVVVVFTTKDELCSYQQKTMKKQEVELTALDDNPCAVASRITESGNILLTVGIKFDGALYFPQLNLGSQYCSTKYCPGKEAFKNWISLDEGNFAHFILLFSTLNFAANCYCLSPYVQYKRDEACVEEHLLMCLVRTRRHLSQIVDNLNVVHIHTLKKLNYYLEIQTPHHVSGSWLALEAINGVYQWNGENVCLD
uniref:Uncharacterized protein n=1 Tax=Parascaris equorum TaxID=6256 RepID=A0A914RNQ1_PAREQ